MGKKQEIEDLKEKHTFMSEADKVCGVCGVRCNPNMESDFQAHLDGRLHEGYTNIRAKVKELRQKQEDKKSKTDGDEKKSKTDGDGKDEKDSKDEKEKDSKDKKDSKDDKDRRDKDSKDKKDRREKDGKDGKDDKDRD